MSDWPAGAIDRGAFGVLSSVGENCVAAQAVVSSGGAYNNSATWSSVNQALFTPVTLTVPVTVYQLACFNGTAVSGNIDLGIYDSVGTRLVSSGSTAQAGTTAAQVIDITDTNLVPGVYYLAQAMDNTTGTIHGSVIGNLMLAACGVVQMASAFPLPSTATYAGLSVSRGPVIVGVIDSSVF